MFSPMILPLQENLFSQNSLSGLTETVLGGLSQQQKLSTVSQLRFPEEHESVCSCQHEAASLAPSIRSEGADRTLQKHLQPGYN